MVLSHIYSDTALKAAVPDLPGVTLATRLAGLEQHQFEQRRLEQACRKLCLMWQAGDSALEVERDFWTATCQEVPMLFGNEEVLVHYHLEALVLFARSSLDICSGAFGGLLPDPFPRRRFDSFNKLLKALERHGPGSVWEYFEPLRRSPTSWLSITTGTQRGRSLRDKISHQMEFPLEYKELHPPSQKEYAVVSLDDGALIPLPEFVRVLRHGVLEGFSELERAAVAAV